MITKMSSFFFSTILMVIMWYSAEAKRFKISYPVAEHRTWQELSVPVSKEQYITAMGGLGKLRAALTFIAKAQLNSHRATARTVKNFRISLGNWFDTARIIAHDVSTTLRGRGNNLRSSFGMEEYMKAVCEAGAKLVESTSNLPGRSMMRKVFAERRNLKNLGEKLPPLATVVNHYYKVKDTINETMRRSSGNRGCTAEMEKFKEKNSSGDQVTKNLALLHMLRETSLCTISESMDRISDMLEEQPSHELPQTRSSLEDAFAQIEREAAVTAMTLLGPKAASKYKAGSKRQNQLGDTDCSSMANRKTPPLVVPNKVFKKPRLISSHISVGVQ